MTTDIKYQYAFIDGDRNQIISINDINNDNRKLYRFRCIGCGHELLPRAINSKYRRPHFYHKEVVTCSGETYLHKLTKQIIKQEFDTNPTFYIEYITTKECNAIQCKYKNHSCRTEHYSHKVDLKKYYDTCSEEVTIEGYIADLLLTNSKSNIPPILIEICVSHPCDEDKRKSGLRIVEIEIKEEKDVISIQKDHIIREPIYIAKKERRVEFISFRRELKVETQRNLQRYIFNPQQSLNGYFTEVSCHKPHLRLRKNSMLELNIVNIEGYRECDLITVLLWMAKHKGLRRCLLCKFYYKTWYENNPICRLSKEYGKPTHPAMDEAEKCNSYQQQEYELYNPDKFLIEEVTSYDPLMKPEYKVILIVSRSFSNYELFKEKFLYYLSDKIENNSVVVLTGASEMTDILIERLSKEIYFIKESYETDWARYGQGAINVSNEKMTSNADALIAFWDGKSMGVKNMIDNAKQKNIKVEIVKY